MIGFFHENDEYGCLSNWYQAGFDYVHHFANSEQYMMYHKVMMFHKYDLAEQIMETTDPAECKKITGQKFPEFNPEIWEKTCYDNKEYRKKIEDSLGRIEDNLNSVRINKLAEEKKEKSQNVFALMTSVENDTIEPNTKRRIESVAASYPLTSNTYKERIAERGKSGIDFVDNFSIIDPNKMFTRMRRIRN